MLRVDWAANTAGDGYWSSKSKRVRLTMIAVSACHAEETFAELRVYFDKTTWNVPTDGLIYTDSQFLEDLKDHLFVAGYDPTDVNYSEQGMQGSDYVSLDVGRNFLRSWAKELA